MQRILLLEDGALLAQYADHVTVAVNGAGLSCSTLGLDYKQRYAQVLERVYAHDANSHQKRPSSGAKSSRSEGHLGGHGGGEFKFKSPAAGGRGLASRLGALGSLTLDSVPQHFATIHAPAEVRRRVASLLRFRNQCVERPFVCSELVAATLRPLEVMREAGWAADAVAVDERDVVERVESEMFSSWSDVETQSRSIFSRVRWPATLAQATAMGLAEKMSVSEGLRQVRVTAMDGSASLRLAPHGRFFRVSWLSPLDSAASALKMQGGQRPPDDSRDYCKIEQVFPVNHFPGRWEHPLRLAQALLRGEDQEEPPRTGLEDVVVELPLPSLGEPTPAQLGNHFRPADFCLADHRDMSLALLHADVQERSTFPANVLPCVEWRPDATFWLIPGTLDVQVILHADDSSLELVHEGSELHHFIPELGSEQDPRVYIPGAVPKTRNVAGGQPGLAYELASVAEHAVRFRRNAVSLLRVKRSVEPPLTTPVEVTPDEWRRVDNSFPAQPIDLQEFLGGDDPDALVHKLVQVHESFRFEQRGDALPGVDPPIALRLPALSTEMHDTHMIPGVGEFVAFTDGRVRAKFFDRAVVRLSGARDLATVLLPDGDELEMPVDPRSRSLHARARVHNYLAPVLDFASWVFLTPRQRRQMRAQQRLLNETVRLEADRTRRLLAIQRGEVKNGVEESGQRHPEVLQNQSRIAAMRRQMAEIDALLKGKS